MTQSEIISKLQKILARTKSPNQHEAEVAMAMAQELLIRHNLSLKDLEDSPSQEYTETGVESLKKISLESKYIFGILEKFFFVKVYINNVKGKIKRDKWGYPVQEYVQQLTIVGTPENVEIATYVYNFLKSTYKRLFNLFAESTTSQASPHMLRKSFYIGLRRGLIEKLTADRHRIEAELAVVLVDDEALTQYMEDKDLRASRNRRSSYYVNAHAAGVEQGRQININPGLGGSANKTLLLS